MADGTIQREAALMSTSHAHESLDDVVEFLALDGLGLIDSDARPRPG